MRRARWLAPIVLTGAVVAGMALILTRSDETRAQASVSDVTLDALDGSGDVRMASFAGHPVVVNYFTTWCPFCVLEMPGFGRVERDLKGRVAFVGIALRDDHAGALRLAQKTEVSYTLAADDDGESFDRIGGQGMPTTLFVDPRGKVVGTVSGPLDEDALRARIRKHFGL